MNHTNKNQRRLSHFCLASVLLGAVVFNAHAAIYRDVTPAGAKVLIQTPDNWQPGRGLVIVNHGFQFERDEGDPSLGPNVLRDKMLSQGYAIAASSFSTTGWALFSTEKDSVELINVVQQRLGNINAVGPIFVTGGSMGGLVSVQQLEMAARGELPPIAGALSLCPPLGGSKVWDAAIDFRVAYDNLCENVTLGELPRGDSNQPWLLAKDLVQNGGSTEAYARVAASAAKCLGFGVNDLLQSDGMRTRRQKLLNIAGIKEDFLPQLLFYSTFALSDIVHDPKKLGGVQALDTREVNFGDTAINASIRRLTASSLARAKLARYYTPNGRIGNAKLLAITTEGDDLVVPQHLRELDTKFPANQWRRALVRESTGSHCGFSNAELLSSWENLRSWTQTSIAPKVESLNLACEQSTAGDCRFQSAEALASLDTRIKARAEIAFPQVDAQINGDWFAPTRAGEGIKIEALGDGMAVVSVFTYPSVNEGGEQMWLTGTGRYVANGIRVDQLYRTRGARFGSAFVSAEVQLQNWGTLDFALSECGVGQMSITGPAGYGTQSRELKQLSRQQVPCYSRQAQPNFTALSGSWYDPARSGEGISFTLMPDRSSAMLFYTYTPTGEQAWFAAQGRFDGNRVSTNLLRPVGARYGDAFNSANVRVEPMGTVTLEFLSCTALRMSYQTPWGSRTQTLSRLGLPLGSDGCQFN
jgi:hypothetical protein